MNGGRPHAAILALPFMCLSLAAPASQGQERTEAAHPAQRADSLRAVAGDTTRPRTDTARAASPSGVDTLVTYSAADSIVYALPSKTMYLYGKGDIAYRELALKAERINMNWNVSTLHATGVPDTADTTGKKFIGLPDLVDGGENYHGKEITYNFKSKQGKIDKGDTEMDEGYYHGEEIKKVETDVLFVEDGRFTTCDLPNPHYFFFSPEMKVTLKDKVVARPVYLYIAGVPVFALPFAVFPAQHGRRSGIITPAYGESSQGRYLLHLGYYWAINDYMDWNVRGDGYTGGSWVGYTDFRYNLRYQFRGGISASFKKTIIGERGDPSYNQYRDFDVNIAHDETFDPTTHLVVNFTFASSSYFQRATTDFADLLQQNLVSNATLSKYWEGTPNSLTLNIRRDQNLRPSAGTTEISEILPGITFNRSQTFPFRSSDKSGGASQHWWDLVGYTYAGQFLAQRTKTTLADGYLWDNREGVQHAVTVNASPKVSYFTFTPFFNYTEKWYPETIRKTFNPADSTVTSSNVQEFRAVRYFNMGVSASTKLYGMFHPGVFGITGLRHQVTPSISYTFQPDFSKPSFRYFGSYVDQFGRTQQYSYFEKEVFGGAPAGEQQAISMNVGNVFEMKTASQDTSGNEQKYQLLNLNLGLSYNFAADSLKFSEIAMDFRTAVGQYLSIGGSSRFNMYAFRTDPLNPLGPGYRINRFLLQDQGRLADLTSFSISVGTHLSGQKHETKAGPIKTAADSLAERQKQGYVGLYEQPEPDFSIPWNLDLTWNFFQNQQDPRYKLRSSTLSAMLSFNLTEFWKITASANYDLVTRQFATPQITVYRDLHCWEMNFYWVPTGPNRQYRFEIRVKAPQLQDIKVTRQSSASGIY